MCIASCRASSGEPPFVRTSTPTLFAGGWTYAASDSPRTCLEPASARRSGCSRRGGRRARPASPRARRRRPRRSRRPPRAHRARTPGSRRSSRPARSRSRRRRSCPSSRRSRVRTTPSLVSRSARFAADAMPFLAQELGSRVEVAFGLLRARACSPSSPRSSRRGAPSPLPRRSRSFRLLGVRFGGRRLGRASASACGLRSERYRCRSRVGRRCSRSPHQDPRSRLPRRPRLSSAPRRAAFATSAAVTFCFPASMPLAIARTMSEHDRIASSLPGIT